MLMNVFFVLIIIQTAKSDVCYYKSQDRWMLTSRGRDLRELDKKECKIHTSPSTEYEMCKTPHISTTYRLNVCRCINVTDHVCRPEDPKKTCLDLCTSEKVCANNGKLLHVCEESSPVPQNISCSCPDDFRGKECGEVQETRTCNLYNEEEVNLTSCDSNATTSDDDTCLYRSHNSTYRCTKAVAGLQVKDIQKSMKHCSEHAESWNDKRIDKAPGKPNDNQTSDNEGPKTERYILIAVIGVLVLIIFILLLLLRHYRRKALTSQRRNSTEAGEGESMLQTLDM